MTLASEIEALRARAAALLAERAVLRREWLPGETIHPRSSLSLAPREAAILRLLLHRPQWSRLGIAAALSAMRQDDGGALVHEPPRNVDVAICGIRRKLKPFGVEIRCYWGKGFGMPAAQRKALAELLSDEAEALDAEDAR